MGVKKLNMKPLNPEFILGHPYLRLFVLLPYFALFAFTVEMKKKLELAKFHTISVSRNSAHIICQDKLW